MNVSNRFEIETLARQQQAEIQRRLRGRAHLAELEPSAPPRHRRPRIGVALIVAATTIVSAALALGMSTMMVWGFAMLR
jgi:hypothetical protein